VVERLGVSGDRRRELGQLRGGGLQLDSLLEPLENAGRLAQLRGFAGVDQPGQGPVGG
jgi:hypothetical protein